MSDETSTAFIVESDNCQENRKETSGVEVMFGGGLYVSNYMGLGTYVSDEAS